MAHILVADDDPWVASMVAGALRQQGHDVAVAPDGGEALRRAQADPPDLVLADVMMPVLSGWGLVRALRSEPRFALVPFIFLTALAEPGHRMHAWRLGADDYLVKPFGLDDLRERVARVLGKRRELALGLQARVRSPADLSGTLREIGLSSLLLLLEMERKSGVLVVRAGAETGRLFLHEGRLLRATVEGGPAGAEAIYHLLAWRDGDFELQGVPVDMEDEIGQGLTALLLEGARRIDEAGRGAS